jgi:hypothetical protein
MVNIWIIGCGIAELLMKYCYIKIVSNIDYIKWPSWSFFCADSLLLSRESI